MHLNQHAELRSQQRRISAEQLEWLLTYGTLGHNKGVCLYFFDRDGFNQLIRDVAPKHLALAERSRNIYAVVAQSTVVTLGYRDERLKPQKPHKRIRRGVPRQPAARRMGQRPQ
jgi:hypothetical protein